MRIQCLFFRARNGELFKRRAVQRGLVALTMLTLHGIPFATLPAQSTVDALGGVTLRYHGDTIWRIRDTTVSRIVYRGDTAKRSTFVHGKLTFSAVYIAKGDVVSLVEQRGGDGKLRALPDSQRLVPASIVMSEQMMLENAIRSNATMARMANMRGGGYVPEEAPPYPTTPASYPLAANLTIVQHLDTVRYIRGCAAAPPADTTIYRIMVGDSLRRVSPSPRTFDRHMVLAVRADINSAFMRRRMATDQSVPSDLPRLRKWPCDNR